MDADKRKRSHSDSHQSLLPERRDHNERSTYGTVFAAGHASIHQGNNYSYTEDSDRRRKELIASLDYPRRTERFYSVSEPGEGTYAWILDEEAIPKNTYGQDKRQMHAFRKWLISGEAVFWVTGKPGTGKSCLMKYLTSRITAEYQHTESQPSESHESTNDIVLSHFFWLGSSALQRSMAGCMRSILIQLLQEARSSDVVVHRLGLESHDTWTEGRLFTILKDILNTLKTPIFLLIDGLDECDAYNSRLDPIKLLTQKPTNRVCISSRAEQKFMLRFEDAQHIRMQEVNRGDIDKVVHEDLLMHEDVQRTLARDFSPTVYKDLEELAESITFRAEGVFLWVHLVINRLIDGVTNCDSIKQLRERLDRYPSELTDLYSTMLKNAGEQASSYAQDARLYLNLALHRSFTLEEFCFTDDELRGRFTQPNRYDISLATLEGYLSRTVIHVRTRTAGLLEVAQDPFLGVMGMGGIDLRLQDDAKRGIYKLRDSRAYRVDFIHRTVRDYLLDTAEGMQLLGDKSWITIKVNDICAQAKLISGMVLPCFGKGYMSTSSIREVFECHHCDAAATERSIPLVHGVLNYWLATYRMVLSPLWTFCDISREWYDGRWPCVLPQGAHSRVDLVPFLLAANRLDTAKKLLHEDERQHDPRYLSSLIAPLMLSMTEVKQNHISLASLLTPGQVESTFTLCDGEPFTPMFHIAETLSRGYLEVSVRERLVGYDLDLSMTAASTCLDMSRLYIRARVDDVTEFWGDIALAMVFQKYINLTYDSDEERNAWFQPYRNTGYSAIRVIATCSIGEDPQLRAVTESDSKTLLASFDNRADITVGKLTFSRRFEQLQFTDQAAQSLQTRLASQPLLSFAAAMSHMGKSQRMIAESYKGEKTRMDLGPPDKIPGWIKWFWGSEDPPV